MNPQSDTTPGLRLPQPSMNPGQLPQPMQTPLAPQVQAPQPAQHTEAQSIVAQPQLVPETPPAPATQPQRQIPTEVAPIPATAPTSDDSDDSLDEEWINKAKTTIQQFKADPYTQSRALAKLRAEYMLERHNKTLKVDDIDKI